MTSSRRDQVADLGRKVRNAPRPNLVEGRMRKFLREPPSVRTAAGAIVTTTMLIVVGGGILMRVLDHREYGSIWVGMWWALQTVTTVGYGDVTPKAVIGRIVASFVMLEGIAFLAIITAAIASTFITAAERERALAENVADAAFERQVETRLDELTRRFDRLESILREQRKE
jgi:voltage-gated potassium channel